MEAVELHEALSVWGSEAIAQVGTGREVDLGGVEEEAVGAFHPLPLASTNPTPQ